MSRIKEKIILSHISVFHIVKLAARSLLFLAALWAYVRYSVRTGEDVRTLLESYPVVFGLIWIFFFTDMLLRFFPSPLESPGCQKVFRKNYVPAGDKPAPYKKGRSAAVFAVWALITAVIAVLYKLAVIDVGAVLLTSLFFSVCDLTCILFYCPFQELIMKNKCCTTCRIYNWDYLMMFSPCAFVPLVYTRSLFAISLALFLTWEYIKKKHPERFNEGENAALRCENCPEKLCRHKKSLQRFLRRMREKL
ncbi:MAG: hypothetical protein IJS65_00805 [Clostridia bacterium]|nr:hypothetical protein [Clostridia bacterium]